MRETRAVRPAFPIHYLDQGGSVNDDPIPVGFCQCGCGRATPLAPRTNAARGTVKGQPNRYLVGHAGNREPQPWGSHMWEEIERGYITACWIWLGAVSSRGYPRTAQKRERWAHRVAWMRAHGRAVPEGLEIDHLCKQTLCVNPQHLEAVTPAENCRRASYTKLSLEQVRKIREEIAAGISLAALGRRYGVTASAIRAIKIGKNWRDI